jgi:hypothetical protein
MYTGMHLVTRGKGYQLLERPSIQQALTHPPTASMTRKNTGEVVELGDRRLARVSGRTAPRSGDCDPLPGSFSRFHRKSRQARGGVDV